MVLTKPQKDKIVLQDNDHEDGAGPSEPTGVGEETKLQPGLKEDKMTSTQKRSRARKQATIVPLVGEELQR